MRIKGKMNQLFRNNVYKYSEERIADRLLLGQTILEGKRQLWSCSHFDSDMWDEVGFQVFSQSNEDGIIQYLIHQIDIPNKSFIEFGVENYTECNTRFLLLNNNWSGLIMDGSRENMEQLKNSSIYWRHNILAKAAFITKDNINQLISEWSGAKKREIGILSIDIDGMDYWVWKSINCINPRIVICEFNPIFGADISVTVPYKADFNRTDMHYSNLYWGASLGAYVSLAKDKGYKLVCVNQMGQNAFFVRNEEKNLDEVTCREAYRGMNYRESRDEEGNLTYLSQEEGLKLIGNEMVVDVTDNKTKRICDCV